jgi:hypothetical protein
LYSNQKQTAIGPNERKTVQIDLNDILQHDAADADTRVREALGGLLRQVTKVAGDDDVDHDDRVDLLNELTAIAKTGKKQVLTHQPFALGSGSRNGTTSTHGSDEVTSKMGALGQIFGGRSAVQMADLMLQLFSSFDRLTPDEQNATAVVMGEVAHGGLKVNTATGKLELEETLAATQQQLGDANDELRRFSQRFKPIQDEIDAVHDNAEKTRRMSAVLAAAKGTTPPVNTTISDERNALKAAVADIDSHLKKRAFGSDRILEVDPLTSETKALLPSLTK